MNYVHAAKVEHAYRDWWRENHGGPLTAMFADLFLTGNAWPTGNAWLTPNEIRNLGAIDATVFGDTTQTLLVRDPGTTVSDFRHWSTTNTTNTSDV